MRKHPQTPFPMDWEPAPFDPIRENEVLRRQLDAARQLITEAWDLVTRLSRPLTTKEIQAHCLQGYELDFIEIMRERQENRA